MNMRPGSKKAARSQRKPRKMARQKRRRMMRNKLLLEKIVVLYARRKPPTEMTVLLRLINILGLALLVMVVAILGNRENLEDIVELGRQLFHSLP